MVGEAKKERRFENMRVAKAGEICVYLIIFENHFRISITKSNYFMHIINSVSDAITAQEVDIFISNCFCKASASIESWKSFLAPLNDNITP